ncbi:MAG: hypothetical protein U0835_05925 [Isosphaeraceae bacterium]
MAVAEVQLKSRTGQSRGFGMVEMPNQDEARARHQRAARQGTPGPGADRERVAPPSHRPRHVRGAGSAAIA